jgi:hypothetical protein
MPVLKIIKPFYYKLSYLEKFLENKLLKHKIFLPQPEVLTAEDLAEEGIIRQLNHKIGNKCISLKYWKYLGTEDFIRFVKKEALTQIKSVSDQRLLKILNNNQVYSETISLTCSNGNSTTEVSFEETMPYSIKENRFAINFRENPKLFTDMLLIHVNSLNIKPVISRQICRNLEHRMSLSQCSIEESNEIIKKCFNVSYNKSDYVAMFVLFYVTKMREIKN